jgi:hypothetical protein
MASPSPSSEAEWHSCLLEPRQAIIDLRRYPVVTMLDQQVLLGGNCVTPRMCDGVFYVFVRQMKVAPNAKRQVANAADPVIEFVDEIPNLIPAVRIHVIRKYQSRSLLFRSGIRRIGFMEHLVQFSSDSDCDLDAQKNRESSRKTETISGRARLKRGQYPRAHCGRPVWNLHRPR